MKCTDSEKQNQLNHYNKRMDLYKNILGGKCVVCGITENLEIDHINPESKSFTIGSAARLDLGKVLSELEKCQLLCRKHHLNKTREEGSLSKGWTNQPRLVHGSAWTYKHHKCRCEVCVLENKKRRPLTRKLLYVGERQHGQRRTYLKGCRCGDCRKANADYAAALRIKKPG